jgi:hypothetical protein
MTPLLTKTWRWQSTDDAECCRIRCTEQDTLSKLAWGHVMVGLSFLFLSAAGYSLGSDISGDSGTASTNLESAQKVSFLWVLAHIALLTLGELHVQPVGLSFISRYAPDGYASIMMGVWYTGECDHICCRVANEGFVCDMRLAPWPDLDVIFVPIVPFAGAWIRRCVWWFADSGYTGSTVLGHEYRWLLFPRCGHWDS